MQWEHQVIRYMDTRLISRLLLGRFMLHKSCDPLLKIILLTHDFLDDNQGVTPWKARLICRAISYHLGTEEILNIFRASENAPKVTCDQMDPFSGNETSSRDFNIRMQWLRDWDSNNLCAAIATGDIPRVRGILDRTTADIDFENPCFGRPLNIAVTFGRVRTFRLLLEYGANVTCNVHNPDLVKHTWWDMSPLRWLCLSVKVPPMYRSHGSVLLACCREEQEDLAGLVLRRQKVLLPREEFETCIEMGIYKDSVAIVSLLFNYAHAYSKEYQETLRIRVFLCAAQLARANIVKEMIRRGVKVGSYYYRYLSTDAMEP